MILQYDLRWSCDYKQSQVRVQLPTSAVNVTLLASAAQHRAARRPTAGAVDRYLLPARHSAANLLHAARTEYSLGTVGKSLGLTTSNGLGKAVPDR